MSINIFWDEQYSHIIHLVVEGGWTWDEFYQTMNTIHRQMDETAHDKIQFIVDMRNGQMLPQDILTRMKEVSRNRHPKTDRMVVVGAGTFPKLLFDIMEKLLPERMKKVSLVNTMEAAYDMLFDRQAMSVDG